MRKIFLLAIPAILASCGPNQYTINGKADESMEGKQVLLVKGEETVDSCVIANGAFAFSGMVEDQTMYVVNVEQEARVPVFLENGVKVTIDLSEAPAFAKDNGGMNDTYASVLNKAGEASSALNEKAERLMSSGVAYQDMMDSVAPEFTALMDIYRDGITSNKNNYVGAYIMSMVAGEFYTTLESLDSAMAEVKYAKDINAIQNLRKSYEALDATGEGKAFVDFTGQSVDGNASSLSDYVGKGKYVLVDFWASWCGPCKGEIPNLIELNNKFGGDNFTVLGVNVWDDEARFKAALESEGITYPQIFVPTDNKDNATELYGIKGIPQIILFAPDGTIVKRDLRGEGMKQFVAEQLQK